MPSQGGNRSGGVNVSGQETRTGGGDISGRDKFDQSLTIEGDNDRSREHVVGILNKEIDNKNKEIERLRAEIEDLRKNVGAITAAYATVEMFVLTAEVNLNINEYLMTSCLFLRERGLCEQYMQFHQGINIRSRAGR